MTDTPMDQDIPTDWYDRSRHIAAWAWLYHAGLVTLVSVLFHRDSDRRTRLVYAGLAGRDILTALSWRRKLDPPVLVATALVTDVAAGFFLRRRISGAQLRGDRSIGQFGVAAAWALLLDRRNARVSQVLALPLAIQLSYSAIWRLGFRETIWYVAREITWSAASLWAVGGLREQMEDAARAEQRIVEVKQEAQRLAEEKAAEVGVWFRFHERLSVFNNVRSRAGIQSLGQPPSGRSGYRLIENFARAEHDRFRRNPSFLTLDALVSRILTARPSGDSPSWDAAGTAGLIVELQLGLDDVHWLLKIVQGCDGPVLVRTVLQAEVVQLEVQCTRLNAASTLPGWQILLTPDSETLRGSLPRSTG